MWQMCPVRVRWLQILCCLLIHSFSGIVAADTGQVRVINHTDHSVRIEWIRPNTSDGAGKPDNPIWDFPPYDSGVLQVGDDDVVVSEFRYRVITLDKRETVSVDGYSDYKVVATYPADDTTLAAQRTEMGEFHVQIGAQHITSLRRSGKQVAPIVIRNETDKTIRIESFHFHDAYGQQQHITGEWVCSPRASTTLRRKGMPPFTASWAIVDILTDDGCASCNGFGIDENGLVTRVGDDDLPDPLAISPELSSRHQRLLDLISACYWVRNRDRQDDIQSLGDATAEQLQLHWDLYVRELRHNRPGDSRFARWANPYGFPELDSDTPLGRAIAAVRLDLASSARPLRADQISEGSAEHVDYLDEPLLTITTASVQDVTREFRRLARYAQREERVTAVESVVTEFADTLMIDQTRPIGAYVVLPSSPTQLPQFIAMLPTSSAALGRFTEHFAGHMQVLDAEEDIFRISAFRGGDVFVRFVHEHVYIGLSVAAIRYGIQAPEDVWEENGSEHLLQITLHMGRIPKTHWNAAFGHLRRWFSNTEILAGMSPLEVLMVQMSVNHGLPEFQADLERIDRWRFTSGIDRAADELVLHFESHPLDASPVPGRPLIRTSETVLDPLSDEAVLAVVGYSQSPRQIPVKAVEDRGPHPFDLLRQFGFGRIDDAIGSPAMSAVIKRVADRMHEEGDGPLEPGFFLFPTTDGRDVTWLAIARNQLGGLLVEFSDDLESAIGSTADERRGKFSEFGELRVIHYRFSSGTYHFAFTDECVFLAEGERGLQVIRETADKLSDATPQPVKGDFRLEYRALRHRTIRAAAEVAEFRSKYGPLFGLAGKSISDFVSNLKKQDIDIDAPVVTVTGHREKRTSSDHYELRVHADLFRSYGIARTVRLD